jgi:DNA repair exonuclease SbcCD ATPase subunit
MTTRLTILGLLCLFSLDCFGQSLADVARKERERQKQTQPQTKTVIVESGVTATTTAGTSATTETAPLPMLTPGGFKDNNGHDEKYWRDRFQQARNDAKRAEARVQLLENKLKEFNTQYLNRTDIYNRENVVGKEIGDTQKQLDDAHKEADQANQKITDLEDELHKAGGPAGWAR